MVVLTGLGFVIAGSNAAIRVLFAMGRERALPGPLATLSRRQTPVVAIIFIAAVTLALGLPLTYAYGGAATAGYLLAAGAFTLVNLLPFVALGWLALGVIAAGVLRARRPASFQTLGQVFLPDEKTSSEDRVG